MASETGGVGADAGFDEAVEEGAEGLQAAIPRSTGAASSAAVSARGVAAEERLDFMKVIGEHCTARCGMPVPKQRRQT